MRSTFVTVVAWVSIVFSAFSSLIGVLQNIMVWLVMRPQMGELANTPSLTSTDGPMGWMSRHIELYFATVLLTSLITLASSIGLLRRKNWARITFVAILGLGIAWMLFSLVHQVVMFGGRSASTLDMGHFRLIVKVIAVMSAVISIAIAGLFAWIIKRLVSPAIREEFAPQPG